MKFRERRQEESGLDLTPFIDVVFLLLLFFVVSSNLQKKVSKLNVDLPRAEAQGLTEQDSFIEIGVNAQGQYFLNGKQLKDSQQLKRALSSQGDKTAQVILMGDKAAPHQAVVSALEAAANAGMMQVQIVANAQ